MKKRFCISAGLLTAFLLWTAAVCRVDVASIGPNGSAVGLAALNGWFHRWSGVHMTLYTVTDWLGLIPVAVCAAFAVVGLCQWVARRRLLCVDADILVLGGYYVVMMALYVLFEEVAVNYRPILINGCLEASYPSSTTLLTLCVMPTAMRQVGRRIRCRAWRRWLTALTAVFTAFMVVGRLLSGVHWLSDIVGGVLLSSGLVALYDATVRCMEKV